MNQEQRQYAFDKAFEGVIAQGYLAMKSGTCAYIVEADASHPKLYCGVGQLLKDDDMRQSWEAHEIGAIGDWCDPDDPDHDNQTKARMVWDDLRAAGWNIETNGDIDFLGELQNAHDQPTCASIDEIADFARNMITVAKGRKLDATKVTKWLEENRPQEPDNSPS